MFYVPLELDTFRRRIFQAVDCTGNNNQNLTKARKGGHCDALQLGGGPTQRQSLCALITRPEVHQPTNSTLPQPLLDSATPTFLLGLDILTIGNHLLCDLDL